MEGRDEKLIILGIIVIVIASVLTALEPSRPFLGYGTTGALIIGGIICIVTGLLVRAERLEGKRGWMIVAAVAILIGVFILRYLLHWI